MARNPDELENADGDFCDEQAQHQPVDEPGVPGLFRYGMLLALSFEVVDARSQVSNLVRDQLEALIDQFIIHGAGKGQSQIPGRRRR